MLQTYMKKLGLKVKIPTISFLGIVMVPTMDLRVLYCLMCEELVFSPSIYYKNIFYVRTIPPVRV